MTSDTEEFEELLLKRARFDLSLKKNREDALLGRIQTAALAGARPRFEDAPNSDLKDAVDLPQGELLTTSSSSFSKWSWLLTGAVGGAIVGFTLGVALPRANETVGAAPNEALFSAPLPSAASPLSLAPSTSVPIPQAFQQGVSGDKEHARSIAKPLKKPTTFSKTKVKKDSEDKAPPASFYEEMSYLRRAQAALRDGKPAMAWGLMVSLDEMNTKGALFVERQVTKVLALCALSRTSEAKKIAAPLLSTDSGAVYANRLKGSCASANFSQSNERIVPSQHTEK